MKKLFLLFIAVSVSLAIHGFSEEPSQGGLVRENDIVGLWLMGQSLCEGSQSLPIVTSTDNKRKVIMWWNPGKSMIANAYIPCIHADPYFGTLKPGEEAAAEGLILFTEGELEPVVNYLMKNQ